MEIKRFEPLSCAKIAGVLYAFIGIFFGAIFSLMAVLGGAYGGGADAGSGAFAGGIGMFMGVAAIVLFPIGYGALGFLSALIGSALYNLFSGIVGGIRVDVQ